MKRLAIDKFHVHPVNQQGSLTESLKRAPSISVTALRPQVSAVEDEREPSGTHQKEGGTRQRVIIETILEDLELRHRESDCVRQDSQTGDPRKELGFFPLFSRLEESIAERDSQKREGDPRNKAEVIRAAISVHIVHEEIGHCAADRIDPRGTHHDNGRQETQHDQIAFACPESNGKKADGKE